MNSKIRCISVVVLGLAPLCAHAGWLDDLSSSVKKLEEMSASVMNSLSEAVLSDTPATPADQGNLPISGAPKPAESSTPKPIPAQPEPAPLATTTIEPTRSPPSRMEVISIAAPAKQSSTPSVTLPPNPPASAKVLSGDELQRAELCRTRISDRAKLFDESVRSMQEGLQNEKAEAGFFKSLMIGAIANSSMAKAGMAGAAKEDYAYTLKTLAEQCVGLGLGEQLLLPLATELEQLDAEVIKRHASLGSITIPGIAYGAAEIYEDIGQYDKAERIYRKTLDSKFAQQLAPINPTALLTPLAKLANMYVAQGRNNDAVRLYDEFIEAQKTNLAQSDYLKMAVYPDAADLNYRVGDFNKGVALLEQARKVQSGYINNPRGFSADYFKGLNALSSAVQVGQEVGASLFQVKGQKGASSAKLTDADSSSVDRIYIKLAIGYFQTGRKDELRLLYMGDFRNLVRSTVPTKGSDNGKWFGFEGGAEGIVNLMPVRGGLVFARMFTQLGMPLEAQAAYADAFEYTRSMLLQRWVRMSMTQYMERDAFQTYKEVFNEYLASTIDVPAPGSQAGNIAFENVLQFKGSLLDFENAKSAVLRTHRDESLAIKVAESRALADQMAKLDVNASAKRGDTATVEQFIALSQKLRSHNQEIGQIINDDVEALFRNRRIGNLTDKIREALPKGAAYIDFVSVSVAAPDTGKHRHRYFAFVAKPDAPAVQFVDLGDAEVIDALVTSYQKTVRGALSSRAIPQEKKLKEIGRLLYAKLMAPLMPLTSGAKRLIISPDGVLHLVSYEALVAGNGRYVVEETEVAYVTSGIDLLRETQGDGTIRTALVIGAPAYGAVAPQLSARQRAIATSLTSRTDLDALKFTPLDDTKEEAEEVARLLSSKQVETQTKLAEQASKASLLEASPNLVHIATHGFFLPNQPVGQPLESAEGLRGTGLNKERQTNNPMHRAGLALAGANLDSGTGVLYASEIAALNLSQTNIAVLSACDTGVGEVESGDGLFGLKRAFINAGARSVVTSLWPVASAETTKLMAKFYESLVKSSPSSAALRESKLQIMQKYPNPYYWGAFVLTGSI